MARRVSSAAGADGEVARLTRELNDAFEQQTATSEVLQVISSSPGDLQPVFAAMLENAARICDAKFGNIFRWDGDALCLIATHNTPPAFAEYRKRRPLPLKPTFPLVAWWRQKQWSIAPMQRHYQPTLNNAIRTSLPPLNLEVFGLL
jgi:hypothetical protein